MRRPSQLDLVLASRGTGEGAIEWLYRAVRSAILGGQLSPGSRLPATRELARHYGLARGTVVTVFDQLTAEGYLEGRPGSGTYVSSVLPDDLLQAGRTGDPAESKATGAHRLSRYGRRVAGFPPLRHRPTRAFRTDQPALDLFPISLWTQLTARRLRRATPALLLGTGPLGYPPLQEAIAEYLTVSRGARCEPGQIAIVSGVQEALTLAALVLVDPGDRVAMEDPGYLGARLVFEGAGAELVPVELDQEGMLADEEALREVRLVYLTPAHQFPTGVTMSLARRLALIEWGRRTGGLIFEDDYDSEYRYSGRPIPALQGLGGSGQVLLAGSFSKVLFPSLRLGYLVIPPDLVDRFAAALSSSSRHASVPEQAVLADFIVEGHFGRHLRRMREIYAERLGILLEEVRIRLAGAMEIGGVEAGLQTTAWLAPGLSGTEVAQAAARREVEVTPLSRYALGPLQRDGLHLGFAAVDGEEIRRGVRELGEALRAAS